MATTIIFVIFVAYYVISESAGIKNAVKLDKDESEYIIKAHNAIRAIQRATAMKAVTYSQTLAKQAMNKSKGCRFRNSEDGFNYWFTRNTRRRPQLSLAMQWWWRETRAYSHSQMACSPGRTCNHYLQLVYNKAEEIGCGMALCNSVKGTTFSGAAFVVVCAYNPAGPSDEEMPYQKATPIVPIGKRCKEFGDMWEPRNKDKLCGKLDVGGLVTTGPTDTGSQQSTTQPAAEQEQEEEEEEEAAEKV